jgi:hypothetical protein
MMTQGNREHTAIDAIAEEWVDTELELFPEYHVYLGRPGREGESADYSPAGADRAIAETRKTLKRITEAEADRLSALGVVPMDVVISVA